MKGVGDREEWGTLIGRVGDIWEGVEGYWEGVGGYTWGGKWAYIWVGGAGDLVRYSPRLVLLTQGCDIKKGESP